MVACRSALNFSRQGILEQGLGNLLKKAISGEGMQLMKMEGKGRVYVADSGKMITLLRLAGESIFVNGNDVLAFEDGIQSDSHQTVESPSAVKQVLERGYLLTEVADRLGVNKQRLDEWVKQARARRGVTSATVASILIRDHGRI
jgi:hypothetical protein